MDSTGVFSVIGDSHDGQFDVCRLVAMVIWSWTLNVVNRGQNVPVGSTPTHTIGPRSRSRLSPRYVLVVLKWRKNRSIFKARRVFSLDFVQCDSLLYQPTDEHNRERFACESDHSRLATIIVDVAVSVESLPVVWIAYKPTLPVYVRANRSTSELIYTISGAAERARVKRQYLVQNGWLSPTFVYKLC